MKETDHLFITLTVIFSIIESHSKNNKFLHIYSVEQKPPPWFFLNWQGEITKSLSVITVSITWCVWQGVI